MDLLTFEALQFFGQFLFIPVVQVFQVFLRWRKRGEQTSLAQPPKIRSEPIFKSLRIKFQLKRKEVKIRAGSTFI